MGILDSLKKLFGGNKEESVTSAEAPSSNPPAASAPSDAAVTAAQPEVAHSEPAPAAQPQEEERKPENTQHGQPGHKCGQECMPNQETTQVSSDSHSTEPSESSGEINI